MKPTLRQKIKWMVFTLPIKNKYLYRICRRYADLYEGAVGYETATNGEWRFQKHVLANRTSPVVFDVGANQGDWTARALSVNPKAKIYAFEPISSVFQKFLAQGFPPNVMANQMGMGDEISTLQFYLYKNTQLNSTVPKHGSKHIGVEEVQVSTVVHFCQQQAIKKIDLLKIDVEGHDLAVLKGATLMLQEQQISFVQFEYGDNYIDARIFLKDVFSFIEPLPYQIYRVTPDGLMRIRKYSSALENFRTINYALIAEREIANFQDQYERKIW